MTYSFEAFCADNRRAYDADGVADLESIRLNLERLIRENPDFVARECTPEDEYGYRELYTDPETGFIVYSTLRRPTRRRTTTAPPGRSTARPERHRPDGIPPARQRLRRQAARRSTERGYRLEPGRSASSVRTISHQIHLRGRCRFHPRHGATCSSETLTYEPETDSVTVIGAGSAAGEQPPDAA